MKRLMMMLMGTAAMVAATGLHATGDWEQFHGNNGNTGVAAKGPDLRVYDTPRFAAPVDGAQGFGFGPPAQGPVVMDGRVFAYGDSDGGSGCVIAFDESTGARLWKKPVAPTGYGSWSSPSASNGKVYMGAGSYVYCFDAETGATNWTFKLTAPGIVIESAANPGEMYGDVVNAAVTIVEEFGLCYMHTYGSFGGGTRLHAINIKDGSLAWVWDTPGQGQGHVTYNPATKWIYTTSSLSGSWSSGRGTIAALDAKTGKLVWQSAGSFNQFSFGGISFNATLNWVVAGSYDFGDYSAILVCDATTGAEISYTGDGMAPAGDYTPVITDDGMIYMSASFFEPGAYAYDGYTGVKIWQQSGYGNWNASATYAKDVGGGQDAVYAPYWDQYWEIDGEMGYGMLDPANGNVLKRLPYGGGNAAIANGNLYFVSLDEFTYDANLLAFGPAVHIVDVECGAYGKVSPARRQGVADGESITFTFDGDVADILVNDVSIGVAPSYTFTSVTSNQKIAVRFSAPADKWEQFHGSNGNTGTAATGPDLRIYNTPRFQSTVDDVSISDMSWWMPGLTSPSSSGPVVADGRVFCFGAGELDSMGYPVASAKGSVMAFDESTGAWLWTTVIQNGTDMTWSSPSVSGGKVYVPSGDKVYCLDAATGDEVWAVTLCDVVVDAAVTIAEDLGLCYIHAWGMYSDTRLYALDITDGSEVWTKDFAGLGQGHVSYNPAKKWVYTTMTVAGEGKIVALNAQSGTLAWSSADSLDSPCYGGIAFDAGLNWVVAAGYDYGEFSNLLVVDATSGLTISRSTDFMLPAGDCTPTISPEGIIFGAGAEYAIYYGEDGPFIYAVDGYTGNVLWVADEDYDWSYFDVWGNFSTSVVHAQDIGTGESVIYGTTTALWAMGDDAYGMFSAVDGKLLKAISMQGGNAALANGNLYFINGDGKLVAFGPAVHVIEVNCNEFGTVSTKRVSVVDGGSVTITFDGYIVDVELDGGSIGAVPSYTFSGVTASHTLDVTFAETKYVTYVGNSGKNAAGHLTLANILCVETYTGIPTDFTRTGYTFGGWTNRFGTILVEGMTFAQADNANGFYAKWTANDYTVTFDPNAVGATVSPTSKVVTFDSTYGTLPTPANPGNRFNNWYTVPGTSGGSAVSASTRVSAPSNHTIYARWTPGMVVTLNGNGGTFAGAASLTLTNTYSRLPTTVTRPMHLFYGWTNSVGTTVTNGMPFADANYATNLIANLVPGAWMEFRGNGGTNAGGDSSTNILCLIDYNGLPTDFVRTGYDFVGWFTQPFGGGVEVTEGMAFSTAGNAIVFYAAWTVRGGGSAGNGYDDNNDGTSTLTGTTKEDGEVYVDDTDGIGNPVTKIGRRALFGKYLVSDVYLPPSITYIGEQAFANCLNMETLVIPEALDPFTMLRLPLYIDDMAFAYCHNLKVVVFEGDVGYIGKLAFSRCPSLETIVFYGDVPDTMGEAAFYKTHPDLKIYYDAGATHATEFEALFDDGDATYARPFWDPKDPIDVLVDQLP